VYIPPLTQYYIYMLNNSMQLKEILMDKRSDSRTPYPFHAPTQPVPSWMKPSICNKRKK